MKIITRKEKYFCKVHPLGVNNEILQYQSSLHVIKISTQNIVVLHNFSSKEDCLWCEMTAGITSCSTKMF